MNFANFSLNFTNFPLDIQENCIIISNDAKNRVTTITPQGEQKMKFIITVTSECISAANNRPYNSDKLEGQNNQEAQTAREAIEKEIKNFGITGTVEWFDEVSCMVKVSLESGNEKCYFFDACGEEA